MNRRRRLHVWLYRRYLRLTPPAHRARHDVDQLQLFTDLLAGGRRPRRLWAGAVPDLLTLLRADTRRAVMFHFARGALHALSLVSALAGLALAAVAVSTDAVPGWVAAPAAAIAIQGIYTLTWLRGRIPLVTRTADAVFVVGEATALVMGAVGLTTAMIAQSGTADPEYGPLTALALVTVHAISGLVAAFQPRSTNVAVTH